MAFWGDYHTHTTYSHGKGSVADNARAAAARGLKQIAITDHGLKHAIFSIKRRQLPKLRRDCAAATAETGVLVLAGIENNFNSFRGTLDLKQCDIDMLDIIQGGFHKAVFADSFAQQFSFQLKNWLTRKPKAKLIAANTDAYLKLIDNYELDFIGHLNRDITADAVEVARYAKSKGTYIEINCKHLSLSDAELEKMTADGVEFICNSDAHSPERVGDLKNALDVIERLHIPYTQIANWDKLPNFRSGNYARAVDRARTNVGEDGADV